MAAAEHIKGRHHAKVVDPGASPSSEQAETRGPGALGSNGDVMSVTATTRTTDASPTTSSTYYSGLNCVMLRWINDLDPADLGPRLGHVSHVTCKFPTPCLLPRCA